MADVSVDTGSESNFVSQFETEGPGPTSEAPSAGPAAGLASETVGTPAAQALGGSAKSTEATESSSQPTDLASVLEKMLAEESGAKPQAARLSKEAELAKMLEGIQPGTPAHQRIQALANARTEAQEAAAQRDAQVQQFQGYIQQQQQQHQAEVSRLTQMLQTQQSQMQVMAANFEALKSLAPKPPVDPANEIRQQWQDGMQDILKSREQAWEKERLAPLQAKIDAIEAREKQAQTAQQAQSYYNEALQAVQNVTLNGFELKPDVSEKVAPRLAAYALAEVLNHGGTYQAAAQRVRHDILQVAAAAVRAASKGTQGALNKGKEAPTTTTSRRVDGQGSAMPALDKLHEMGFRDEMAYLSSLEHGS